ncbi:MAG: winged helix-turn-helix domain-containing protein [Thermoanaerobaculia bacterium]
MGARSAARPRTGTRLPVAASPAPKGALGLDAVVHGRLRLGILSALSTAASLTFVELKELLGTTDGNLSVHARKLELAGYVVCEKGFEGRVPRTAYRLSEKGRKALGRYLDHMEALIRAARRR